MSRGLNKVLLIGNLGQEPDCKWVGQAQCAVLSIATTEYRRSQQGDRQEYTEWHRVSLWGRLADVAAKHLHKGARVYIEGQLRTRSWEQDGVRHYMTEVVARELIMLDGRREGHGSDSGHEQDDAGDPGDGTPF